MVRFMPLFFFFSISCTNSKTTKPNSFSQRLDSTYQRLTTDFLLNLYQGNEKKVMSYFDTIVLNRLKYDELEVVFKDISTKIRREYESPINFTFITSEKTIHENVPATFLVLKVESIKKFGYYFFYISD